MREDQVPRALKGALVDEPLVQAKPGAVLLTVPTVGRFLVTTSGEVILERNPGVTDADVRCFLTGPVAAAAGILRGDLVLRAAAVSIVGRAVALCGPSAVGKSALAAALGMRGHALIADAVASVRTDAPGQAATIGSSAAEPVLWPDVAAELCLPAESSCQVRPGLDSRTYRLAQETHRTALGVVVLLGSNPTLRRPQLTRLTGAQKVRGMLLARWHARLSDLLGLAPEQLRILADSAAHTACVRLDRPTTGAPPAALAELVEELVS